MIARTALLLAAGLMLGSCCLSGNCYAPVTGMANGAGVAATALDGLGPDPADEPQADAPPPRPRKTAQRRRDADSIEASSASRYRGDAYEEQLAADKADEARLKRKLIICQNCASSAN